MCHLKHFYANKDIKLSFWQGGELFYDIRPGTGGFFLRLYT
jgi:hypothetical protein